MEIDLSDRNISFINYATKIKTEKLIKGSNDLLNQNKIYHFFHEETSRLHIPDLAKQNLLFALTKMAIVAIKRISATLTTLLMRCLRSLDSCVEKVRPSIMVDAPPI